MISYDLLEENAVIIIRPEGSPRSFGFRPAARVVDPFLTRKGHLQGILIQGRKFPGGKIFLL